MSNIKKQDIGKRIFFNYDCFPNDNPPLLYGNVKKNSFDIDLSEKMIHDKYIVDKIAIIPYMKDISFECFIKEKK